MQNTGEVKGGGEGTLLSGSRASCGYATPIFKLYFHKVRSERDSSSRVGRGNILFLLGTFQKLSNVLLFIAVAPYYLYCAYLPRCIYHLCYKTGVWDSNLRPWDEF